MTHPAKFLCGHLAHGYEKCNGCVAEARTREIAAQFDKIAREGSATEAEFACWARAIMISDFIPKEKP